MPTLQDATAAVDQAAANVLGINLTDLRCLGLLHSRGTMPAGELAEALSVTRGAGTSLIDRLVNARYVRRSTKAGDRRSVLISLTPLAKKRIDTLWGPVSAGGELLLTKYSAEELELIAAFLEKSEDLQRSHAKRLAETSSTKSLRALKTPPIAPERI